MQPAPEPELPLRLDGLSVLVVDDTPQVASTIVAMLRRQGARGIPVASAPAALEALARERPDVLLADVAMPGENGYSMIRKIRALPPERGGDIPAAALTASDSDPASLLAAGFDIYLPKPFTLASLARTVPVLARLGRRRLQEVACGASAPIRRSTGKPARPRPTRSATT